MFPPQKMIDDGGGPDRISTKWNPATHRTVKKRELRRGGGRSKMGRHSQLEGWGGGVLLDTKNESRGC